MSLPHPETLLCFILNNYIYAEGGNYDSITESLKDEYLTQKDAYKELLGLSLDNYFSNIIYTRNDDIYQHLKLQDLTIIPIATAGHSMIFVITKDKSNPDLYIVRFINSGLGCKYHQKKIDTSVEVQAMIGNYCTFEQTCQIIFNAHKIQTSVKSSSIDDFYKIVIAEMFRQDSLTVDQDIKMENKLSENIWIEPQYIGNCTWRSLYLSLKIYCCQINKVEPSRLELFFTKIALRKFNILMDQYLRFDVSGLNYSDTVNLVVTEFFIDCLNTRVNKNIDFECKKDLKQIKNKFSQFMTQVKSRNYLLNQPEEFFNSMQLTVPEEFSVFSHSNDEKTIQQLMDSSRNRITPYPDI